MIEKPDYVADIVVRIDESDQFKVGRIEFEGFESLDLRLEAVQGRLDIQTVELERLKRAHDASAKYGIGADLALKIEEIAPPVPFTDANRAGRLWISDSLPCLISSAVNGRPPCTPVTVVFRSLVMSLIITFMFEPAKVYILEEPMAGAIGAKLPITEAIGTGAYLSSAISETLPLFTPVVGNFAQGMITMVPLQLHMAPEVPTGKQLHEAIADHYAGISGGFVEVAPYQEAERGRPQLLHCGLEAPPLGGAAQAVGPPPPSLVVCLSHDGIIPRVACK